MNNRLNEYLTEVESRLRSLPNADCEQELAEVTQHLETLIAVRVNEGQTEDDATVHAIAQFGAAHDIGNQLYKKGEHKRFVPLFETALFCAAASGLFSTASSLVALAGRTVLRLVQAALPDNLAQPMDQSIKPSPFYWWQVGWVFGIAALAALLLHYGGRGVVRKAAAQTPTGAAVRWLFLLSLTRLLSPGFFLHLPPRPAPMASLSPFQQGIISTLPSVVGLVVGFVTAYWVGRTSKSRESVADAVGCAVVVGAVEGLLSWIIQYVTLYRNPQVIMPDALSSFLLPTLFSLVYTTISLYVARFGVQRGEARRPPLGKEPNHVSAL